MDGVHQTGRFWVFCGCIGSISEGYIENGTSCFNYWTHIRARSCVVEVRHKGEEMLCHLKVWVRFGGVVRGSIVNRNKICFNTEMCLFIPMFMDR